MPVTRVLWELHTEEPNPPEHGAHAPTEELQAWGTRPGKGRLGDMPFLSLRADQAEVWATSQGADCPGPRASGEREQGTDRC